MKNYDRICMERMTKVFSGNTTWDHFKEFSKIKGRNNFAPIIVYGFNIDHDIIQVFYTKYKNIYNSVPCNSM